MHVKMENIGGLSNFEAEIKPKKVTYIIAPNTAGKTSFVRGLEAVFGEVDPREVINISKTKARIIVTNDEEVSDLTFHKTPNEIDVEGKYPKNRDPRSSLISFILPESKVVQDIALKDGDLRDFLGRISKADEYKYLQDKSKVKLTDLKEKLETLRKDAKEVPKLQTIRGNLEGKLSELKKQLEGTAISEEAKELQKQLNKINTTKDELDEEIEQKKQEIAYDKGRKTEVEQDIKELEGDIKNLEKEIPELNFQPLVKKFEKRVDEVRNKISHEVKPELNRAQVDVSKLQKELDKIKKGEESVGYCPFDKQECQRFSKDVLKTQLDYDKERFENVKTWYDDLNKEYKGYMEKIRELKSKETDIIKYKRQISEKTKIIRDLEDKIDRSINDANNLEKDRNEVVQESEKLESTIRDLVSDKSERRKEIEKDIDYNLKKLKEIDSSIKSISKRFDPEKSVSELEEAWEKEIEQLREEVNEYGEIYDKQLYGEALEFNNKVDPFLKTLGFDKNFHKVLIDPNTQKLMVYKTPTESQPLSTLSTSERYALAILIMLVANKIYIPDFPLIVLDEVLISFDEERGRKVIDYIKNEVPYVITTALKESGSMEVKTMA